MKYTVHDILRMRTDDGFRVWRVTAVIIGGLRSESHYEIEPLERDLGSNVDGKNSRSLIPCAILDACEQVQKS